jgi:hypothetical protein
MMVRESFVGSSCIAIEVNQTGSVIQRQRFLLYSTISALESTFIFCVN